MLAQFALVVGHTPSSPQPLAQSEGCPEGPALVLSLLLIAVICFIVIIIITIIIIIITVMTTIITIIAIVTITAVYDISYYDVV